MNQLRHLMQFGAIWFLISLNYISTSILDCISTFVPEYYMINVNFTNFDLNVQVVFTSYDSCCYFLLNSR